MRLFDNFDYVDRFKTDWVYAKTDWVYAKADWACGSSRGNRQACAGSLQSPEQVSLRSTLSPLPDEFKAR
ncbi:hypothetical protein SAMN06265222_12346 [Neorhodopirellula lusitana]|uniref:Uncharacterized protein n=1 Tax=Neorhodopirellula lusitana TaxID=445327 RepID=A0ABY1QRW3_9BACT|nr:hypothetical protein SAMN06265222_12346 [Neorhodopirellula lusitana]